MARFGNYQIVPSQAAPWRVSQAGRPLVYSVCSFEPEETLDVIAAFQKEQQFVLENPLPFLFYKEYFLSLAAQNGYRWFFHRKTGEKHERAQGPPLHRRVRLQSSLSAGYVTMKVLIREEGTIACPDTVGKELSDARRLADRKGSPSWSPGMRSEKDIPYNYVISQRPEPNMPVRKGRIALGRCF